MTGGIAVAGLLNLWWFDAGTTLGVFVSILALCALTGVAALSQSKHRSVNFGMTLFALVLLFLAQQSLFGTSLTEALLFATPRLAPGQLSFAPLMLGTALFATALWLEQRAATATVQQ